MAEIAKGIIDIEINTGGAASELKALQSQINAFNLALNKNNASQAAFTKEFSGELQKAINKTGLFTAETIRLSTAAATLDKTLSKGKTSLGQFFSAKFNKDSAIAAETMALAAERAKRLQTQFIATAGAANGFQDALAVRPLAAFSSEAAVAAQRTQILSNMFKQGTTQLINFGKNVQWAGRQLMVGFTVPLTIFGAVAGKTFMELEKQAVAFKKVYGDIFTTPAELNKNLEAVKGLAAEYTKYGVAVKDTIGLAAQAAAAGRQDAELTDAVTQATRLATLGQMDQNAALETTISLQSAFRLSGKELGDTINFLNMVENQTVVSLQDIAAAIPRVAPVIQGLGGDVKDLTVFLAAMQEGGVDAAEGANALKSGLASLINPTKQANEMLSGMGINLQSIIESNKGDLMGTVRSFAEALQGLDQFSRQQALEQVFGKFQYAKLGALFENISREGSQAQQVIATMGYSTEQLGATADKELKTIEESFGVQLTGAVERFKLAIAPIGEIFVRLAIPIVNLATKIADSFNGLSDGQKRFAAIAAVIVGVVIPAVTMMAGLFLNLVGTLAKIGQGMALFGKGFITGGPVGAVKALTQSSKYLSLAEMDAAMAAQQLSGASKILNTTLVEQAIAGNTAAAAINNLTRAYSAMAATQGAAGNLPTFGVAGAAGAAAREGKASAVRVRGLRRNSGGGVPGSGNTDTVPAMLTPGEFVVNKDATKENLGLLRSINDGNIAGYNKGGKVPGVQYFGINEPERIVQSIQRLMNIPGGFGELNGHDSNIPVTIRRESEKQQTGKPTFAHMQRNLVGVESVSGTGFRGGAPIITGNDAIAFFENLYNSDKKSWSDAQKHYFEAGRLTGFTGWRVTGNLGFDISKHLNSGVNNTQDLIDDLSNRMKSNKNPYSTMLNAMGITSEPNRSTMAKEIHEEVTTRLRRMNAIGKTTYVDTDLYRHMEKAVPRAVIRSAKKMNISESIVNELFSPEKAGGGIRASAPTASQVEELVRAGKIDAENVVKIVKEVDGKKSTKVKSILKDFVGKSSKGGRQTMLDPSGTRMMAITSGSKGRQAAVLQLANLLRGAVLFNSGGPVPGSGNTDTVPAMLTPGEFVVNKKATSQNQGILEMMNGGNVKGYALGGIVTGAGTAAQMGGLATGNMPLMIAGTVVQMLGPLLGKVTGKGGVDGAPSGISGGIKNLGPVLKNIATVGGRLSVGMTSMVGGVALAGLAIYKLNKSASDAEKAGAKLAEAMYGSAKTTKAMADAFGRETNAAAIRRKAVEKAGGQDITQESVAASGEFMKSDAAAGIIEDLKLVKKSGEDASLALRNQLASSIVAGAITPEEAKAIAIDMGKAIGDEKIAIQVAGQLSSLLGPNGEKLNKNIVEITAEISPKIDTVKIKNDADKAFEELNIGQKFGQLFTGGEGNFVKDFAINEISERNAAALAKEAESRAFLNLAYQEGTIALKEYLDQESKITAGANERSSFVDNANAQALGFTSTVAMQSKLQEQLANLNIDTTGMSTLDATTAVSLGQARARDDSQGKAAYEAIVTKSKEALKQTFINEGMDEDIAKTMTDSMEQGVAQIDPGIFDKFLSGQIPIEGYDILMRLESAGNLTPEDIDRIGTELTAINTIPNVDKILDFNMSNEADLTEIYDQYVALEKEPDIFKGISIKDQFSEIMSQFGIEYAWLASLPNQEKIILLRNMETFEKYNSLAAAEKAASGGYVEGGTRQAQVRSAQSLKQNKEDFGKSPITDKPKTGGGSGGNKEEDLLKMLMERFRLQEMLIDKEAEGFNERVKQLNREIELEERQVSLRQKGLDQLSKKEEAVNKAYDLRVEALDKVSESNSRVNEQEKSRISLASALASGDIAAAAGIAGDMQQQSAQYQIEDARAALEKQRQVDLDALTVSINGKLMTRKGIEFEIEQIQDRIYARGEEVKLQQDQLLILEDRKLAVAKEREKVETRMYLLEQQKNILDLKKLNRKGKLDPADKQSLAEYTKFYNQNVDMYNAANPGANVARMANGGIAYRGSTEPPPAMRMNYGSTVPGNGMTDKVSALLTPGEFVVRKSVADENRGFLNQLNSQVFPAVGKGISSPTYSVPGQSVTNIPVNNTNVVSNSSPMYNSTYNVNVNVSGTNASPDDIANVVMAKLSQQNRGNLRSNRY